MARVRCVRALSLGLALALAGAACSATDAGSQGDPSVNDVAAPDDEDDGGADAAGGGSDEATDDGLDADDAAEDDPEQAGTDGDESDGDTSTGGSTATTGDSSTSDGGSTSSDGTSGPDPSGSEVPGEPAPVEEDLPPIKLAYVVADTTGMSALTGSGAFDDSESGDNSQRGHEEMRALVQWANDTGGINGRPIEAKGWDVGAADQEEQDIQVCIEMTEDYGADVVIDQSVLLTEPVYACFADHETPFFTVVTDTDTDFLAGTAPYVNTMWAALDRQMIAMGDALPKTDYLDDAVLGVILADVPVVVKNYEGILAPRLADIGAEPEEVVRLQPDGSGAENAVLRMRSAGVDHIIFIHNILGYLRFTNTAESQGYRPRYAFGDYGAITGVAQFYGSPSQNADALGISVSPGSVLDDDSTSPTDLNAPTPREEASPGLRRCYDIYSEYIGTDYYASRNESGASAGDVWYCDNFFQWLDVARASGERDVSGPSWATGLDPVGDDLLPVVVNSGRVASGIHDAASTYAVGVYTDSCRCFVRQTDWLALERS